MKQMSQEIHQRKYGSGSNRLSKYASINFVDDRVRALMGYD